MSEDQGKRTRSTGARFRGLLLVAATILLGVVLFITARPWADDTSAPTNNHAGMIAALSDADATSGTSLDVGR